MSEIHQHGLVERLLELAAQQKVASAAAIGVAVFVAVSIVQSSQQAKQSERITSRQYDKPYRPTLVKVANAAIRLGEFLGVLDKEIKVNTLLAKARKATGLQDFGDMWFVEPLTVLVDSINKEAKLTSFGRVAERETLVRLLSNRLHVEALLKKHPEIRDIDIGKVIVIAGLQRTGTTVLQRLISADPRARSLIGWEAVTPMPLPNEEPGNPKQRIAVAKMMENCLAYLSPDLFAVHPIDHRSPDEDVLLLDMCFLSQLAEACMWVPTYAKWQAEQDHTRAYEYLYLLFKILTFQNKKEHWVVKTPHHMGHLDVILKVFPKVLVVQTHRDPLKTTGSFCSMVAHASGVLSDSVDPRAIANQWTTTVKNMMKHSIAVRAQAPPEKFIDLYYKDLLVDPLHELKRVYDAAGITLSEDAKREMETVSKRDVQHRYGRHVYQLEDFGLTKDIIDNEYKFYREQYNIPRE